jgi:hypothetical protein
MLSRSAALCALALLIGWAAPSPARAAGTASPGGAAATAPETMRRVVRAWSRLLNADDNQGVARLFAVPAVIVQGPFVYRLRTYEQVARWHAGLPCSGTVVSITIRGRYATAVFRLGNRRRSRCDAPGTLAAARFEIVRGKIVSWVQVAVPRRNRGSRPTA